LDYLLLYLKIDVLLLCDIYGNFRKVCKKIFKSDLVLVQEPWVVGGKVAGLGINEYKLMLDPKEGKIRTCILAKRLLSIFLLRNYSNGDNTAVSLELQSGSIRVLSAYLAFEKENPQMRWSEDWQRNAKSSGKVW